MEPVVFLYFKLNVYTHMLDTVSNLFFEGTAIYKVRYKYPVVGFYGNFEVSKTVF